MNTHVWLYIITGYKWRVDVYNEVCTSEVMQESRGWPVLSSAQIVLNDYKGPDFLAVVWFGSSHTPSPLNSSTEEIQEDWEIETTCWQERVWGRSQIIRQRESLVLYKSFNTLCHYISLIIFWTCAADSSYIYAQKLLTDKRKARDYSPL